MKIRLIGDHSAYHCGSAAAWQAISAACQRVGDIVEGDDFDILVVNGEGAMHHDSRTFRKKLAEIDAATASGKKAYLMNTVWQANPTEAAEVLRRCERITVREIMSQQELSEIGIHSDVAVDQSFFSTIDTNAPTKDFGGGPVLTDFFTNDFGTFVRVTTQWTWPLPYIQMHEWDWSSLVKSLPTSEVLVTGRHHAVYAACRARVPFLALKGNTHKIEGLISTAGVDIPVFDTYKELLAAYRAKAWRSINYGALFDWMDAQEPWELKV